MVISRGSDGGSLKCLRHYNTNGICIWCVLDSAGWGEGMAGWRRWWGGIKAPAGRRKSSVPHLIRPQPHTPPPPNMKTFVAVCLLACAAAFPQDLDVVEGSGEPPVGIEARSARLNDIFSDEILRSEFEMSDDGQFQYGFETSDGTVVDAAGENRQIGDGVGAVMRGSYSYKSPEGVDVTVQWVADQDGFRATGPQVPAVPEYVTRLLKSLPAQPQPPVSSVEVIEASAAADEAWSDRSSLSSPWTSFALFSWHIKRQRTNIRETRKFTVFVDLMTRMRSTLSLADMTAYIEPNGTTWKHRSTR